MSVKELKKLGINEVRALMHKLGLNIDAITEVNQGLTQLFQNVLSVEDDD